METTRCRMLSATSQRKLPVQCTFTSDGPNPSSKYLFEGSPLRLEPERHTMFPVLALQGLDGLNALLNLVGCAVSLSYSKH